MCSRIANKISFGLCLLCHGSCTYIYAAMSPHDIFIFIIRWTVDDRRYKLWWIMHSNFIVWFKVLAWVPHFPKSQFVFNEWFRSWLLPNLFQISFRMMMISDRNRARHTISLLRFRWKQKKKSKFQQQQRIIVSVGAKVETEGMMLYKCIACSECIFIKQISNEHNELSWVSQP